MVEAANAMLIRLFCEELCSATIKLQLLGDEAYARNDTSTLNT
jgi:hypothetical protein